MSSQSTEEKGRSIKVGASFSGVSILKSRMLGLRQTNRRKPNGK